MSMLLFCPEGVEFAPSNSKTHTDLVAVPTGPKTIVPPTSSIRFVPFRPIMFVPILAVVRVRHDLPKSEDGEDEEV